MNQNAELRLNQVGVERSGTTVLSGVTAAVPAGEVTVIVGPNGSGKSTLLQAVAGLQDFHGTIEFSGRSLRDLPRRERVRQLAYVEQGGLQATDARVREIVELGRLAGRGLFIHADEQDRHLINRAMTDTAVDEFAERSFAKLSGGEQQRTQVARALAQDAGFMLLDEPTNHLDLPHQHRLLRLLRHFAHEAHHSAGVLVALHDLALAARYCDRMIVLNHGEVVATGAPTEVLTSRLLAEVFHIDGELVTSPRGVVMLECLGAIDP